MNKGYGEHALRIALRIVVGIIILGLLLSDSAQATLLQFAKADAYIQAYRLQSMLQAVGLDERRKIT